MPSDAGVRPARHYDRAPIVEASIIIEIRPREAPEMALLPRIGERLGAAYPTVQDLADFLTSRRQTKPDAAGVVFTSVDGKQIVQARTDLFQFTRQAPYDSWETFLPEARKTWECYKDVVAPLDVVRLRVKYVNVIKIPMEVPLRRLFNTYPTLPSPDQLLNALQMRYAVAIPGYTHAHLSVLMVFLEPLPDKSGRMVLDNTFAFDVSSEPEVWDMMPNVRQIKNDTFESQITDELRKTFYEHSSNVV